MERQCGVEGRLRPRRDGLLLGEPDERREQGVGALGVAVEQVGEEVEDVPAGEEKLSFLAGPDGVWAGFTPLPEGDDRVPMWIPYVPVEDLDAEVQRAVGLGAVVLKERTEVPQGSLVVLTEPGGAPISLWQER